MTDNLQTGTTITFKDEGTSRILQDTTGWSAYQDLSVESIKDLLVKVGSTPVQVARFFKDASFGVQLALDGGLRWGTGATPNAVAYYSGDDSKFHVKPIYAGNPPTDGAELKLGSSAAELTKDLDLGSNKLKWGANAELAYNGGTVELNSADLDLDSGKKLKWGAQAAILSSAAGSLEVNGADIDLDSGKKLKWGSSAEIYYDSGNSALVVKRGSAEVKLSGTNVVIPNDLQLRYYFYLDGSSKTRWMRYTDTPEDKLEVEISTGELWFGSWNSGADWLKMRYADSWYYLENLNLEVVADAPSGASKKGRIVIRLYEEDETEKCEIYLNDGSGWFVAEMS
jgi:hypothetical protein